MAQASIIAAMGNDTKLAVPTFLRQWRDYRRLTQEQLAARTDLTAPSISQLETGSQGFTDKSLARLAGALACTPADLLAVDPTRPNSFWPLFQAAERLTGQRRQQLHDILVAAIGPRGGSK